MSNSLYDFIFLSLSTELRKFSMQTVGEDKLSEDLRCKMLYFFIAALCVIFI